LTKPWPNAGAAAASAMASIAANNITFLIHYLLAQSPIYVLIVSCSGINVNIIHLRFIDILKTT
jgi:hypothetical protein